MATLAALAALVFVFGMLGFGWLFFNIFEEFVAKPVFNSAYHAYKRSEEKHKQHYHDIWVTNATEEQIEREARQTYECLERLDHDCPTPYEEYLRVSRVRAKDNWTKYRIPVEEELPDNFDKYGRMNYTLDYKPRY